MLNADAPTDAGAALDAVAPYEGECVGEGGGSAIRAIGANAVTLQKPLFCLSLQSQMWRGRSHREDPIQQKGRHGQHS